MIITHIRHTDDFVVFITLQNAQNSVHRFSGKYRNLVCSAQFFAECSSREVEPQHPIIY